MVTPFPIARRVVVVAPHSDDETIAAHTLIERLRRRGADVSVIVVTDGSASHRNSPSWPRKQLIAERQRETVRAMAAIGVRQGNVRFLGFPDGGLYSLNGQDQRRLVRALARGPMPDLIIVPDRRDAHPDHRNVAAACAHAWPHRVARLPYIVWKRVDTPPVPPSRRVAFPANTCRKRSALRRYRTQTGLIHDDPDGFHLTTEQIAAMCGPTERFVRGG